MSQITGVKHLLVASMLLAACQSHEPQPVAPEVVPKQELGRGTSATLPVGVDSCDRYLRRVVDCKKLSQQARDAFLLGVTAWKGKGDPAKTASACDAVIKLAEPQLTELGC